MAIVDKAGNFLNIPQNLGPIFQKMFPGFWQWLTNDLTNLISNKFNTLGDVTISTAGKGVVLPNEAGTATKRIVLNDAGDGILIKDV